MTLGPDDIRHVAHLARIGIGDDELPAMVDKLDRIVGFVDRLGSVDTSGVVPMAHPLDMAQRLRPDEVTEADERERFQQDAAAVEAGLYVVPRVIE